jgi:hypothetical protein
MPARCGKAALRDSARTRRLSRLAPAPSAGDARRERGCTLVPSLAGLVGSVNAVVGERRCTPMADTVIPGGRGGGPREKHR